MMASPFLLLLLLLLLCSGFALPAALSGYGSYPHRHAVPLAVQSELGFALLLPLISPVANSTRLPRRGSGWHRRQLAGSLDANARMNLYDDLLTKGYFTSRLWIGTPPQEFALIVDTGSTVTYVPCSSCTHCGQHQDPRFNPEDSSSYKPVSCGIDCATCDTERHQCKYERQYAELSSSKGLLGTDLVSFGKDSTLGPQRLVFGCETAETGDIYAQGADGIMGLGRGPLSIVDQLVGVKAMADSFSLCYGGMTEGGGAMVMGAIPSPPGMVYTRSDFGRSAYYNLGLQEILVAGNSLQVDPGVFNARFGTVLDSGTTYAYFPEKAYLAFRETLRQQLGHLHRIAGPDPSFPDECFSGAGTDLSKLTEHFPEVVLKFSDGQTVSLAPENYLFKHAKVPGAYCLGIFNNGKNSATLLGGIIVRNMLVTYDRTNKRLGFWRTNCTNLWHNLFGVVPVYNALLTPIGSPLLAPSPLVDSLTLPAVQPPTFPAYTSAGSVKVEMSLGLNYTSFNRLKSAFLEDLSRELDVDQSQIQLLNFTDDGKNVSVSWVVFLTASNSHLLNGSVESIVTHLQHHDLHFHDIFGSYQMTGWSVILVSNRSDQPSHFGSLILALTILGLATVIGLCLLVWWYLWRYRNPMQLKYTTVNQQSNAFDQL